MKHTLYYRKTDDRREHAWEPNHKSRPVQKWLPCLLPTGMTGIQALNVTGFLHWVQQSRQTGGKVTSAQPLKHVVVSQDLLHLS